MDMKALKKDIAEILDLLPPQAVMTLVQAAVQCIPGNIPALKAAWPRIKELAMPHVKAGMMEAGMEMLDMGELQEAGKEVFGAYFAKYARPATPLSEAETPVVLKQG